MTKETASIRDQMGNDPDTFENLNPNWNETFAIEEQPTIIEQRGSNNVWQVGTDTNAIVGEWIGTLGGGQLIVGPDVSTVAIQKIVSPSKIFHEHFRFDELKGTPFTADWNTTLYRLAMTTQTDKTKMYSTVATIRIAFDDDTVNKVTVSATETKWGNDVIKYYVSADGKTTWDEITTLNQQQTLTHTGTDLQLRIIFNGNGASDTYIEDLRVAYEE